MAKATDTTRHLAAQYVESNPPPVRPPEDGPAILFFDIETAPALVWVWSQWQTNVIATESDWYMLSFAYRWLGQDETHFVSIAQDTDFEPDSTDDYYVASRVATLFDLADVVVAHNGDSFDIKKAAARFLYHGIGPPSPFRSIDTKREAKRYFNHYSNSLNELARIHGLGAKVEHTGFTLWRRVMAGDPEAWQTMEEYNRHDVDLLVGLYERLLPWIGSPGKPSAVNHGFWRPGETVCPKCGSDDLMKNGVYRTNVSEFQTFQCRSCGGYSRARKRESQKDEGGVALL